MTFNRSFVVNVLSERQVCRSPSQAASEMCSIVQSSTLKKKKRYLPETLCHCEGKSNHSICFSAWGDVVTRRKWWSDKPRPRLSWNWLVRSVFLAAAQGVFVWLDPRCSDVGFSLNLFVVEYHGSCSDIDRADALINAIGGLPGWGLRSSSACVNLCVFASFSVGTEREGGGG